MAFRLLGISLLHSTRVGTGSRLMFKINGDSEYIDASEPSAAAVAYEFIILPCAGF